MEKVLKIVEKVNKYAHLEYTLKQYIMLFLLAILALLLVFLFFEKTWSMVKDNIWKWDDVTFLKLTLCMLVPLASIISLNFNFLSDVHLNNWIHFLTLFFILPVFPYLFMLIHHMLYLGLRKILMTFMKK